MKKVCIVFPYILGDAFLSGGVPKLVIANVEAVKEEYNVCIVAPRNNEGLRKYFINNYPDVDVRLVDFYPLARFVDDGNIFTRAVDVAKRIVLFVLSQNNLRNTIKCVNPDIIHFHGEVTFPYIVYGADVNAGTIFHASCFRFSKPKLLKTLVVHYSLRHASLILSPTESIRQLFGSSSKSVLVPNPIITVNGDNKYMSSTIEDQLVRYNGLKLIFVGRICPVKQIHYIIEAINLLRDEDVRLFIIGKPNLESDYRYYNELLSYIEKNNLSSKVFFFGYKNNVDEYMQLADAGVLVSQSEAISMAAIEYLHNSLPIIGFNNPGINETVDDGQDGFLIKDGDISGLVSAIYQLMDKNELARMKKNAYENCERKYSMDTFRDNILQCYRQVER